MTVSVSFGQTTLRRLEEVGGDRMRTIVGSARYYLADADRGRGNWLFPEFRRDSGTEARGTSLEVDFQPELWQEVEDEANRQRVSTDQLLEHAVLYFAADRDSGRMARRLAEGRG